MKRLKSRLIGVISDTHGLLRPEALDALSGVHRIIHAGDVGGAHIVEALEKIAPVSVVRGNNDRDEWVTTLSESLTLEIEGRVFHVLHDLAELNIDPARAGIDVVITGHSHKPSVTQRKDVLYVNPGSAGPRRFSLPITLAHLIVGPDILKPSIVPLAIAVSSHTKEKKKAHRE